MQIIMLLSKVRINSMAVVGMKYSDGNQSLNYDITSSVDQVIREVIRLYMKYFAIQVKCPYDFDARMSCHIKHCW